MKRLWNPHNIIVSLITIAGVSADGFAASLPPLPDSARSSIEAPDGACGTSGTLPVVGGLSAEALDRLHESIGFDLAAVRAGSAHVPQVVMADVPDDLQSVASVDRRKAIFIRAVLPAILFANERIREQRRFLETVRDAVNGDEPLSDAERERLERLAACYGTKATEIDKLIRRVDVVPPGLGLAQAAIESGWGTSRFARQGNALLGQRTTGGTGLVPTGLENPNFRVHSFDHVLAGVMAYAKNLNSHPAYRHFRAVRAAMRDRSEAPNSDSLVGTLRRYSERGSAYIRDLRSIIRANDLDAFDDARLKEEAPPAQPDDQPQWMVSA